MRKTYASLLRLIVVAAMVCSLVAITAAMAGPFLGIAAAAGTANITAGNVTATPATASDTAAYEIKFKVGYSHNITAGGTIVITFPNEVTLPTTIDNQNIVVESDLSYASKNGIKKIVTFATTDPDPTVSGQVITIPIPTGQWFGTGNTTHARCKVLFMQSCGVSNPAIAATVASASYAVAVHTSTVAADSTQYVGVIPSYTISPTTAGRSDSVTVTGKGWTANGGIVIAGGLTGTGTADANGAFSTTAVPTASTIASVTDGAGQSITASSTAGGSVTWDTAATARTFTMKARITVSPTSGLVGSTYYIYGYDFTSTSGFTAANVTIAGATTGVAAGAAFTTRDAYSTLDDCLITATVPATSSGGAKEIKVVGNGTKSATATFTVATPTVTISPAAGPPNTMVTITGTNFGSGTTFTVAGVGLSFAGAVWNASTITADSSGSWEYSVRVPAGAVSGANPVIATSTTAPIGTVGVTAFVVSARTITVTPSTGPSGTSIVVISPNLTASGTVAQSAILFAGTAWNTATGAITVDSLGNLSPTTLIVPTGSTVGSNAVTLTDSGALTAAGAFTVTQPTIEISPSTGFKGDTMTVTGVGWVPGSLGLVTVTFNSLTQVTAVPSSNGTFTAQFAIPLNAVTGQLVGASDTYSNTAASKTLLIDNPTLTIDPASGAVGTEISVVGQGFQPQSAVTALTMGGGSILGTSSIITDALGGFTHTFLAPGLATGAQTISATVNAVVATTFFTVSTAPPTVATAMSTISSSLVRVWGYTGSAGWEMYDPADTIGSDLTGLTTGRGYWLSVDEAVTLVYGGSSWSLDAGWNLIGW